MSVIHKVILRYISIIESYNLEITTKKKYVKKISISLSTHNVLCYNNEIGTIFAYPSFSLFSLYGWTGL